MELRSLGARFATHAHEWVERQGTRLSLPAGASLEGQATVQPGGTEIELRGSLDGQGLSLAAQLPALDLPFANGTASLVSDPLAKVARLAGGAGQIKVPHDNRLNMAAGTIEAWAD